MTTVRFSQTYSGVPYIRAAYRPLSPALTNSSAHRASSQSPWSRRPPSGSRICTAPGPRSAPCSQGGATLTGMIPDIFPENARHTLLNPAIIVPPLVWLISVQVNEISGRRDIANQGDDANPLAATEGVGWG